MTTTTQPEQETTLEALGRTWKVGRWTRRVWNDFIEWAKPRITDPIDVAAKALAKFPPNLHEAIVCHAIDRSQMSLSTGSAEVQSLLGTIEGSVRLLYLLLREHHPNITEDEVFEIAIVAGEDRMRQVFRSAEKANG